MTAVSIRPYQPSDAEKLYEAAKESVAELQPFLPWCHPKYLIDEARSWIQLQVEQFRFGKEYQFVVVSTEGRFLGGCGLNGIDQENRRANLGYWIRSSETRRGAATAATRLLACYCTVSRTMQYCSHSLEKTLRAAARFTIEAKRLQNFTNISFASSPVSRLIVEIFVKF